MAGPIDYTIQAANPLETAFKGYEYGQQVQQRQQEQDYKQQMQQDLAAVYDKEGGVKPNDLAALTTKYPQFGTQFKQAYDMMPPETQTATTSKLSDMYAVLANGQTDMAKTMIDEQLTAAQNSGDKQAIAGAQAMKRLLEASPEAARDSIGMKLATVLGPDKFAATYNALQNQRRSTALESAELTKAEADARRAAVASRFEESNQVADLAKKGWETQLLSMEPEIKRENQRIALMEAKLKKEDNELKRDALQQRIEEAKEKREEALREKTATLQASRNNIDNSLQTINQVLNADELNDVIGGWEGSAIADFTTGLFRGDEEKNIIANIETIQGQQFLDNLMAAKQAGAAFGSLTEKEGQKLEGYIRNLKRAQGEKQFVDNLKAVRDFLVKTDSVLSTKYGVPDRALDVEEIGADEDFNSIMRELGY